MVVQRGLRIKFPALLLGVFVGTFLYLGLHTSQSRLYTAYKINDANIFNSRSLMDTNTNPSNSPEILQPVKLPVDPGDMSVIMSKIDQLLTSLGATSLSGSEARRIGDQVAGYLSEYIAQRLSRTSKTSVALRQPCRNITGTQNLPIVYVITPTYRRPEQMAELTRLGQTLVHVPALHWIVVEDANKTSDNVAELLSYMGIPHTHLNAPMPTKYAKIKPKPRGVANRNAALKWLRDNAMNGTLYFADDDNAYDIRLFEEIRWTKKVAMFPVGLVTKTGLSTPVVKNGKVIDFYDGWKASRKFPVDMAGFAVNVDLIKEKPEAVMPFVPGYEEDGFLKKLGIGLGDIEPKAENCTKIYVWHTQTKANNPANRTLASEAKYANSNIDPLQNLIV